MIARHIEGEIALLRKEFPVIAILGPRQSGKTTLSRKVFHNYRYLSLEDMDTREFAQHDPRGFLDRYDKQVIFDEIQRVPVLITYLQGHADQLKENGTIVITGSHNFFLMEQITQSLAGRVGISKLLPFSFSELAPDHSDLNQILFSGLYPRIHDQGIRPESFYKNYIATYIEKDIRQIKNVNKLDLFLKFIRILAGRTGQELNKAAIADQCGVSHNTIGEWVSLLEASYLVYKLKPYHKNYNKRLVKNPKIYMTDTGLVCSLLGIRKKEDLDYHFLRGHIFETFIVTEFLKHSYNRGDAFDLYFWRDNHRKELDLLLERGTHLEVMEIKSTATIQEKHFENLEYWKQLTGLQAGNLSLVYGGTESYSRHAMHVVAWTSLEQRIPSS